MSDQNLLSPTIRRYAPQDAGGLAGIYHRAVREGAVGAYTEFERRAWSPAPPESEDWALRLARHITLVAEVNGQPVGFMTLTRTGHVDLAYVLPEAKGSGVAKALYETLENEARALGLTRLDTDASHLARRFFEKQNWTVLNEQRVERHGVILTNFRMEKKIG